ncbi:prepilin-type N-terminal cleavage/methylation domain-containing protein [Gallaecimonas mangrovi]|uniref:prepilin-type N-terminal cleavage/methylation domain-containing protein n=1 Tax=Gallaecimonas mangrovi TaxID=2291597 RepID=UPI000E209E9E|nr:prepilin-type N-terminal cleavage/methylation domain-containing protein [Gallaecimonas mangrovi]
MQRRNRGFGLIEVMIAIVVIGIGVAGLVTLQKVFLRNSSENITRSVAMELAKGKLEDFRRFDDVTDGTTNYVDIVSGSDSLTVSGQTFNRSWTVADLYYDAATGSWSATKPNGAVSSDQKLITINVAWSNINGSDSVVLNSSLSATSTADRKQSLDPDADSSGPQVTYTPGLAPDVIALNLSTNGDGNQRETSKPLPEVSKQDGSTLVKFDTVTYQPNSTTLIREDFATINCTCNTTGSTAQSYTPFRSRPDVDENGKVNAYQVIVDDGVLVTKTTGSPASNNTSTYCTVCCGNHFDASSGDYPAFDPDRTAPHSHFSFNQSSYNTFNASTYTSSNFSAVTNGNYLEACRLLRVDGYYRVTQDWQLVDIVMMRKDWLEDADNQTLYQQYVLNKVKDYLTGSSDANKDELRDALSPASITVSQTGVIQLMARGIYIDYLTAADKADLASIVSSGDSDWPSLVPFYDVNLTLLVDWKVTSGSGLSVTNETIKSVDSDPNSDYYGTYSRGALTVAKAANGTVAVRAREGNSGVTGSLPTDLADATNYLEDALAVSLANGGYAVKGVLSCREMKANGNATTDCDVSVPEAVTITAIASGDASADPNISCVVVTAGGTNAKTEYSCTGFSASWVGSISMSYDSYTFNPTSISVDIANQADSDGLVSGTATAVLMCSPAVVSNSKCS